MRAMLEPAGAVEHGGEAHHQVGADAQEGTVDGRSRGSRGGRASAGARPASAAAIVPPASIAVSAAVEPGQPGHAQRLVEADDGAAVGDVGGEHDPLRRDAGEELDHVAGGHARGVVERRADARRGGRRTCPGRRPPRGPARAGPPGTGAPAWPARPSPACRGRRGRGRGTPASRATAKMLSAAPSPKPKAWARGMELDPARAAGEAALRLAHGLVGRVEPAVRHDPAAARLRPGQDAVVRAPVRRVPVGVVEGERAGARAGLRLVEHLEQGVRVERLPVLVRAEVRVRRR